MYLLIPDIRYNMKTRKGRGLKQVIFFYLDALDLRQGYHGQSEFFFMRELKKLPICSRGADCITSLCHHIEVFFS